MSGSSGPNLNRKAFHVAIFSGAVPAQLLYGFWGVVAYGTVVASLVLWAWRKGPGNPLFDGLSRRDSGREGSDRSILLPLFSTAFGGLLSVLLVGDLAIVGYLVCGWGDAAGEIVGHRWGGHRFSPPFAKGPPPTKSIGGSLAVLVAGSIGATTAAVLLGIPMAGALRVGVASGTVGAVAEGSVGAETENLWIQILASLAAWLVVG